MSTVVLGKNLGSAVLLRTITAAPVVADSATINDSNFPPTDATITLGVARAAIHVRLTGGSSPTVTLQPLYRAGSVWIAGTNLSALAHLQQDTLDVMSADVYWRITAASGSPTTVAIYGACWEPFRWSATLHI